jgi:hypothetical protein
MELMELFFTVEEYVGLKWFDGQVPNKIPKKEKTLVEHFYKNICNEDEKKKLKEISGKKATLDRLMFHMHCLIEQQRRLEKAEKCNYERLVDLVTL